MNRSKRYRERSLQPDELKHLGGSVVAVEKVQANMGEWRGRKLTTDQIVFKRGKVSGRSSVVELPEITRAEEEVRAVVPSYRPKKSMRSKLVQDAMHLRDRNKIQQIRGYLKANSARRQA